MVYRSNGGMLCTVFSSIFISRLAMSLKDEEEARRKATEGMIPLASIRTSGTSSDFKSGRDTSLSGATYVNMSTLLANKRISGVSTASTAAVEKDSCIAAATEAAQPNVSSAAENPENPDDYPQWLNRDERPTHMVWMQAAPRKSGGRYITPIPLSHAEAYEASKRAKELVEAGQARAPIPRDTQETDGSFVTIPLTMPSIDSDRADKGSYWSPEYSAEMSKCHSGNWDKEGRFMETAKDISPDMWKGGKLVKRAKSDHPVGRKDGHKQYDRKMTVIPEVSPVPSPSDASFMDRASKITPFVYGSFSVRPAYSTEASPTETTWLGGDLHESPTNLEEAARLAKAQQAPLDVPAHMHDAHPSNTKDTASPTTAVTASDASSEETGSEDASHRIHRVPVPSPVSPKKCSSSRLSSRRVSWTSEITASLQKVQV